MISKRRIGALLGFLCLGAGLYYGRDGAAFARVGTSYVAKQLCSCLYLSERRIESCQTDFPQAQLKWLTMTPAASRVKVTAAFGLFSAEAVYESGYGCHLVK